MSYSKQIILAALERLDVPPNNDGFVRLNELTGIKAATFYNVVKGLSKELSYDKVLKVVCLFGIDPEDILKLVQNSEGAIKRTKKIKLPEVDSTDRFI